MAATTEPTRPRPPRAGLLPVSRAADILQDPHRSAQRRYQAYVRARHRFWEAFPGARYVRLPTPGTDFECGLHAIRLSMQHQHGTAAPRTGVGMEIGIETGTRTGTGTGSEETAATGPELPTTKQMPVPTLDELRAAFHSTTLAPRNAAAGLRNTSHFSADQLAAVFAEWGRQWQEQQQQQQHWHLGNSGDDDDGCDGDDGDRVKRLRFHLGYVADDDGMPVMMNTPEVETGEVGPGIVRVWVYNDGMALRGGVGHFEGLRRPVEGDFDVAGACFW